MATYNKPNIFDERKCPICGKMFFKPIESIYKYREQHTGKVIYVCSYSCWVKKLKELKRW